LFSEQVWDALMASFRLSPRHAQIVRGVFDDGIEARIASDHRVSPHTVHTHTRRLFKKLDVKTRVGLVVRVFRELLNLTVLPRSGLPPICWRYHCGLCPHHNGSPVTRGTGRHCQLPSPTHPPPIRRSRVPA
jgi:DNA-binding CsgD family transcriptional regulator